ncbi:hypothetical protein EDC04DRAFT_2868311 [Pisolithus marmoratus]|nr:hypothetical protein EDC04DRAFT_2868311 [Pisolithus marmoratus]
MLRSLLTPLRNIREPTRESTHARGMDTECIREAQVLPTTPCTGQLKDAVEQLNAAELTADRIMILRRVYELMNKNPHVLDVFCKLDGFLAFMHILSTLSASTSAGLLSSSCHTQDTLECMQLAFMVASSALDGHEDNIKFFEEFVGYDVLSDACSAFLGHPPTSEKMLGCLLSLSFHDFGLADVFSTLVVCRDLAELDLKFLEYTASFGTIRLPHVFKIAWDFMARSLAASGPMRLIVYKILEHLTQSSHYNLVVLGEANVLPLVFSFFASSAIGISGLDNQPPERRLLSKILKRLFEIGASAQDVKQLLQCAVMENGALDGEMIELLRTGMKCRWPPHISLQGSSAITQWMSDARALPAAGFTCTMWAWFEGMPLETHSLLGISFCVDPTVQLSLTATGTLVFKTKALQEATILSKSKVPIARWTHIAIVHYPSRSSSPAIRVFIDGYLTDALDWPHPAPDLVGGGRLVLGDSTPGRTLSWCLASCYLLSIPLDDNLIKFMHGLGPQYHGNFQDYNLPRFFTYEVSTSLNIHLLGSASTRDTSSLKRAIQRGSLVNENLVILKVVSEDIKAFPWLGLRPSSEVQSNSDVRYRGNICVVSRQPFDVTLWRIGGVQLALRLVHLAQTQHELSRTISILCDCIRGSWQNSEEMERIAGYDALADILRSKGHLINMTSFETLFEFLGLNFRSADTSTVTNTIAYRAIALDFELWSSTNLTMQQAHLEHFSFLLRASRHRRFNAKVCLAKLGIVRKLVFALQSTWYPAETVPHLVKAIVIVVQGRFPPNDVIKPVMSYISAHIATGRYLFGVLSNLQTCHPLGHLSSLVSTNPKEQDSFLMQFSESVPLARVVLLWVNEEPSPSIAYQVLSVIGIGLIHSSSFGKKLELLSGWSLLRKRLPSIWDEELHRAAVDLLLRPAADATRSKNTPQSIRCPQILPVILVALRYGLLVCCDKHNRGGYLRWHRLGNPLTHLCASAGPSRPVTELILGDLIHLYKTVPSFSQLFKLQSITGLLIDCLSTLPAGSENVKVSAQLTQLALLVANGNCVSHHQKQQVIDFPLCTCSHFCSTSSQILDLAQPGAKAPGPSPNSSSSMLAVVRDETLRKAIRSVIVASEKERYQKMVVDSREQRRRLGSISGGILKVGSERDVWPHLVPERTWRLDETEGPYRMRIKLEPVVEVPLESRQRQTLGMAGELEISSTVQSEPTADDAADDYDSQPLAEDILEPGDVIEAVNTVTRVSGVDSWPGLLIFGKSHLYMLEGLVEGESGEVISAADAPKDMFFVSGSASQLRSNQPALRWKLGHIVGFSNRSFLFRDVALEVFFKDSRTLLVVFLSTSQCHDAFQRLQAIMSHHTSQDHQSAFSLILRDMSFALPGGKASNLNSSQERALTAAQQQWRNRTISNYAYISILNQLSGRTPNDATQYPIFPWVLQDYTSETLDLSSLSSFRDLAKPMGALTEARREIAESRYHNLEGVGEKPFHYGTHFSSSMIVCHYLIRLAPFTSMFKTLQGGDWDLPDRLFSVHVRGDVRELIPEFFSCPEFLENLSRLDFGISHSTGEKVDDVKLPPWAKDDPLLFVTLHRQALESHYVSENLPAWIDLIWGCKQRDVESLNVFHPLSYEGAIDLGSITDPLEREATIGIIHNFGQTPRKLFNSSHPPRNLSGTLSLPVKVKRGVCEDALALTRDPRPLKRFDSPVAHITIDSSGKAHPTPHGELPHPSRSDDGIRWDRDNEILQAFSRGIIVQAIESVYPTCATFADPDTLVTGSSDSIVRIWHVSYGQSSVGSPFKHNVKHRKRGVPVLSLTHLLRGHSGSVSCIQASRTWSVAVSGSSDGSAVLWDLNRGSYVRSIWHAEGNISSQDASVNFVAINESTGYIATCSTCFLWLHTIAARPIAKLDLLLCDPTSLVSSIAFHEREYSQLGILAVGDVRGSVTLYTWNADGTPEGTKAQWEFVKVRRLLPNVDQSAVVTALQFSGEALWVGDASGNVFRWAIPD